MSASARRYSHLLQTPEAAKSHLRVSSKDRFLTRSIQSTAIGDSIDGNRYSISYLPGISEHIIETGKTLPEAQMKIVMMACELERISAQNYELVKENEVLRTQTIKSEREKDLETKLAIVLAENEKLNQVIEELYNTYMDEKGANTNEVYEKRIAEVVNELEQWKQRYSTLQCSQGGFDVENTLKSLEEENRRLNETLVEKDREMETFRARLEARDPSAEVGVLEEKILWLVEENTKLKEGTKGQKTPEYYERLVREYREKMTLLMAENDNLRDLVEKRTVHETDVVMRSSGHEDVKMAGTPRQPDMMKHNEEMKKRDYDIERLSEKLSAMLMENEKLNAIVERQMEHIEELEKQQRKSVELFSKTEEVTGHNEQLNELLRAKLEETEKMRKEMGDLKVVNTNFDELSVKVKELLERNDELNNLVMEKVYEVEDLKQRLSIVGESDAISEELKQKLLIVTAENERLNRLLVEKIEEVEKIRRDLEKSDSHHEGESVNEGLRKRIRELENDVLIIHELRNKLQLVLVENERLNSLVEGEQARKRLSEIDQNAMKVQELTRTVEILRGEQERMSKVIAEKQAEIDHLRSRYEESGHKIHKSVETLMEENDKLSALVIEKARENDGLRVRINALEGSDRLVEELKIRLHAIITENERLNNIALSEAREHKQLAGQVDEMNRSAVKVDDLKRDVEAYKIEAERLNRAVIEKTMDNERLVMKIAELQSSLAALNEATSTIVKLGAENERLKALVNEKVGELGRVTTLEGKLVLISSENQRLLIEIDLLKTRIAEDKTQELEVRVDELLKEKANLIRHIEALEKEIEGLKGEHLNVVSTLSVDLERHQEELKKAGAHHQRKADEMEMKERRIVELEGEIEMMKKKTEELDEKLVVTGAQKEELALVLEDKEKEIEEFERKSVEDLRRSRIAFDEAENEKKILASEKEMLGKTITTLEEEYKILKGHLNQVLAELEDLRARHGELEMIREQEIEDLRSQFETLKDISKEIKELQVKTAAERVAYETQLAQYQMVKADLERERDLLRSENERLTALAVHRLEEAEKIKRSVIESEEVYKLEVSELKIKVEQYKVRDHEVKKLAIKYGAEKAADQCLINQLQQMNATYKTEIENLYELLDERKTDIESVHKQNEELRHSQSQLIVRLKEHVEMGGVSSQDKLEALQRDFEQVEKSRDEYKHQAQRNSVELARRNKDLVEKIQELDVLKMKYEEAFANYQALNSKLFERLSVEK